MTEVSCPSCGNKIKSGILGSNALLTDEENELIALVNNKAKKVSCQKCGIAEYSEALTKFTQLIRDNKAAIGSELNNMPLVTIHSPHNWDYEVVGLITAKVNLGTGFLTEISTSISDLAGTSSSTYNSKLDEGENKCMTQMRLKAFNLGANAVIGNQVTYSEIGSLKGLVLVCMAGTAVKVRNTEVLGQKGANVALRMNDFFGQLAEWQKRVPMIYKTLLAEVGSEN